MSKIFEEFNAEVQKGKEFREKWDNYTKTDVYKKDFKALRNRVLKDSELTFENEKFNKRFKVLFEGVLNEALEVYFKENNYNICEVGSIKIKQLEKWVKECKTKFKFKVKYI